MSAYCMLAVLVQRVLYAAVTNCYTLLIDMHVCIRCARK
jgi:hypothetical protein